MEIGGLPLTEEEESLILFEVEEADQAGPYLVSDEAKMVASFEEALKRVRPAVGRVIASLEDLAPGELEVEFGLKLNGQAGAVFAKVATEGHLRLGPASFHPQLASDPTLDQAAGHQLRGGGVVPRSPEEACTLDGDLIAVDDVDNLALSFEHS